MSFLDPLALLGGLIAIPIILLYMLRLRRREVLVSSTFLWQQLLEDKEANTPWQRLRRNLLLLLQLIIVALLVLALARPFVTVPSFTGGQTAVLIDASASMNATDSEDGRTRFELAVEQARELVGTLGIGDQMMIIRVGAVPQVLVPFTESIVPLHEALDGIEAGNDGADWVSALTLAAGSSDSPDLRIIIISDGGIGEAASLPPIPGELVYLPVGISDNNLAITALATRELQDRPPQLFAQVTNYGGQDVEADIVLRIDGQLSAAEPIQVAAHSSVSLTLDDVLPPDFTTVEATLVNFSNADYLALDNSASAVHEGQTSRTVLVMTEGNLFLEQVLRSMPGIQAFQGNIEAGLPTRAFDLYIFDRWLPPALPEGDIFFINPPATTPLFTVGDVVGNTQNIIIKPNDPRTAFLDFSDVNILQFQQVQDSGWADVLISADGGPLLLAGVEDGRQVAVLTFALHESDLPLRVAWPVMMANLLQWFTPSNLIETPNGLAIGQALAIQPPVEADTIQIIAPDDTVYNLPVERETVIFDETFTAGIYQLRAMRAGEVLVEQPFSVNLFDEGESNIAPVMSELQIGEATVESTVEEEQGELEFWSYLAFFALLIMLVEWYLHHRRLRLPVAPLPTERKRATT